MDDRNDPRRLCRRLYEQLHIKEVVGDVDGVNIECGQ